MKLIIITVFLFGITNCDKLDNRYLPPHNAQSSSGSQFVHPPTVADLRINNIPNGPFLQRSNQHPTTISQYSPKSVSSSINRQYLSPNGPSGQYSLPASQYSPPAGQYSPPTSQYTPKGGISPINRQYLSPNGPSGQYSAPGSRYSPPTGQYTPKGEISLLSPNRPFGQYSAPISQYSPRSESSSINRQYLSPNSAPTSQYSPSSSQYSPPTSQYTPKGESPSINRRYFSPNAPSGKYSPSTHVESPSNAQISQQNRQYLTPNSLSSGANPSQEQGQQFTHQNELSATNQHAVVANKNYQPTGFGQGAVQPQDPTNTIAILRSSGTPNAGDGSYQYSYETENGISAEEEGSVINDAGTAKGGYSYTSPEGENIAVEYVADENGFQPKGAHIPQIPEAILKSIELNKAAIARGEIQKGQYQEEGYDSRYGYQYQSNVGDFKAPQSSFSGAKQSSTGAQYNQGSYKGQEGYRY